MRARARILAAGQRHRHGGAGQVRPPRRHMWDNKAVLWDIAANRLHRVRGMDGASSVSLALEPGGHIWIASVGPIGYGPRVAR